MFISYVLKTAYAKISSFCAPFSISVLSFYSSFKIIEEI